MSAKLAGRRNHRTAGAAFAYQVAEQKMLGLGDKAALFRGDGTFVASIDFGQFARLGKGIGLGGEKLRRPHPNAKEGELLCLSVPAGVAGAMKLAGLLNDPPAALRLLQRGRIAAMKAANAAAYGRTSGGKPVKGDLLYAVFPGYLNRAGELTLQLNVWVFPTVRAKDGRNYALHGPPLYRAQKAVQAAWHLGVARALHDAAGIVCGPAGNSFTAANVKVTTRRSAEMRQCLKAARTNGPKARAWAAGASRSSKTLRTWGEALSALAAHATGTVCRARKAWGEKREAAHARRCAVAGFGYCRDNAARFTRADAYATGAHLALPRVSPEAFDREFNRVADSPGRIGLRVARSHPDGGVMYEPLGHSRKAAAAALTLWALARTEGGGLTARQVAKALAGQGHPPDAYAAVQVFAENRRGTLNPTALDDPAAAKLLAHAYRHHGRKVLAVGEGAGRALGVTPFSPAGLAEALSRTSHLRSLWRGLRVPGTLGHKLWVAEQIRAHGHTRLKKGTLVVASVDDTRDAGAINRIADAVRKAGGRLVVAGPGAAEFAALGQVEARRSAGQKLKGPKL